MVRTKSVAVMPSRNFPVSLKPITSGMSMEMGCPNMAASASIPPTPQPKTPKPLIMVVCESVPTKVSGKAKVSPSDSPNHTACAKYSRFT